MTDYYKKDIEDAVQVLYSEIINVDGIDVKTAESAMVSKENKKAYISDIHFEIVNEDDLMKSDIESLKIHDNALRYCNQVFEEFFPELGFELEFKKGNVSDRHKDLIDTKEDNYITLSLQVFPAYLGTEIKED